MSASRDWEEIRGRWMCDFENTLDALTKGIKETTLTKPTENQLGLAIETTNEHRRAFLEVIQAAENMDQRLHGIDVATVGRK